ncbi:hypothetical protein AB4Z14_13715 [Terrabacter sp. 2TAF16]|uniref:hypothetical protein n=1 Tax=Terrabacter sp. 2TAF16 TaxID=3233008 RepID=UPI003F9951A7
MTRITWEVLCNVAERTRNDRHADALTRRALRQVEEAEKVYVEVDNDFMVFAKLDAQEALTVRSVCSSLLSEWIETLPEDRALWSEQDRVSANCIELDIGEMVIHATGVTTEVKPKRGWFRRRS